MLLDLSMLVGHRKRTKDHLSIAPPDQKNAGSPHWHPTIHSSSIRQNVAGLWLKYGARPAKTTASLRRKISSRDATIC
jgi:hypothetical protein